MFTTQKSNRKMNKPLRRYFPKTLLSSIYYILVRVARLACCCRNILRLDPFNEMKLFYKNLLKIARQLEWNSEAVNFVLCTFYILTYNSTRYFWKNPPTLNSFKLPTGIINVFGRLATANFVTFFPIIRKENTRKNFTVRYCSEKLKKEQ